MIEGFVYSVLCIHPIHNHLVNHLRSRLDQRQQLLLTDLLPEVGQVIAGDNLIRFHGSLVVVNILHAFQRYRHIIQFTAV